LKLLREERFASQSGSDSPKLKYTLSEFLAKDGTISIGCLTGHRFDLENLMN
jgi:hypothetical protein